MLLSIVRSYPIGYACLFTLISVLELAVTSCLDERRKRDKKHSKRLEPDPSITL